MKKVKFQLAAALLCGVAAMTSSCSSQGAGCYYSATETEVQQKRISMETSHTDYVVHPKNIETAE